MATGIAIAGLVVAVVGAGVGIQQQAAASKDAREAAGEARDADARVRARERRQTIREGRIARGALANQAAQVGATGSSGELGGLSGIKTQVASNIGFSRQREASSNRITTLGIRSNKKLSRASTAQGIGNVGGSVFSAAGGFA